jgi:SAM-dependent methyltransferase
MIKWEGSKGGTMHPVFAPQFRKPTGVFGHLAARYMIKHNSFVYEGIERFAGFESGMAVLEIGFGPGIGLRFFLDRYDIELDGIDFSPLMQRKARRKNKAALDSGRLRLFLGDLLSDGSALRTYDRVIFANVLYFWDDLDTAFSIIKARLRPGGKLVFYMSNKSRLEKNPLTSGPVFNRYDRREVLDSLGRVGFREARANEIVDDSGDFLVIETKV